MRILPVVAAVTAAFLVVACSSPTPPKGVTVVNNFDAKRYLGTWKYQRYVAIVQGLPCHLATSVAIVIHSV
ncbi:hypothetical protein BCO88_23405 [Salmonella enterica subsp. enterica serovar Kentucky]|uniref:Outer membrane lipoprotein n=1 Tax=Salmonella enterica subsp. enterica serovar Kentucky TaxID=192955 RepID=A0A627HRZ3_SALET|nr:hypothetical protein [Salmonella enterica subsp. enterica serovar Kentucky]ECT7048268.1 hypothetical protein [Salmonella enterica subsp. enterica serovar Kentucky]EDB8291141.1 hypothetical protein [Salmonella enterica subsp. enterica serovar Kentucky]KUC65211.1 hypothetical protein DE70_08620 [Salmonella enterica subsp. enterica serovar Kentucky]